MAGAALLMTFLLAAAMESCLRRFVVERGEVFLLIESMSGFVVRLFVCG